MAHTDLQENNAPLRYDADDIKCFAPDVVMTVYSGTMLADNITAVHQCFEHVFGCDLPTHFMGKPAVMQSCETRIYAQVPAIEQATKALSQFGAVTEQNIGAIRTALHDVLGSSIALKIGSGEPDGQ